MRDKKIARYLAQLDEAYRDDEGESINRSVVQAALAVLQVKKDNYQSYQVLMQAQVWFSTLWTGPMPKKYERPPARWWPTTFKVWWTSNIA